MKPLLASLAAMLLVAVPAIAQFDDGKTPPGKSLVNTLPKSLVSDPPSQPIRPTRYVNGDSLVVYTVPDPKKVDPKAKPENWREGDVVQLAKGERVEVIGQGGPDAQGWIQIAVNRQETSEDANGNVITDSKGNPVWRTTKGWVRARNDNPQEADGLSQTVPDGSQVGAPRTDLSKCRSDFLKALDGFKGVPYVWGGTSRNGVDCSGLIVAALNQIGCAPEKMPRTAADMQRVATPAKCDSLKPGDLIFLGQRHVHHVMAFCGDQCAERAKQIIQAKETGTNVEYDTWTADDSGGQTCGTILP